MNKAQQIANELLEFTNARSVFVYGSRARDDFQSDSDYEIGILMDKEKYISRAEIKKRFIFDEVNIFPFHYEEFITGNPDTPFQKSIYMREIIEAGKTLVGEEIIENLKKPSISLLDVIQDVRFNLGYALASTHSYKNKDTATASLHFSKSCLFGTRDYLVFKTNKFPISYDDIANGSKELVLKEYQNLPIYAAQLREQKAEIDIDKLFQNVSYLNKMIEKELLESFDKDGNKILVE